MQSEIHRVFLHASSSLLYDVLSLVSLAVTLPNNLVRTSKSEEAYGIISGTGHFSDRKDGHNRRTKGIGKGQCPEELKSNNHFV